MVNKWSLLILLGLTPSLLWAESPADGVWQFAMSSQMGSVDAKVTMQSEGNVLTGIFDVGGGRTWDIEEGSVNGDEISFKINRDGASMTYVMTGTVLGDTIDGNASALGSVVPWSMSKE